jgi:hypothetical protein
MRLPRVLALAGLPILAACASKSSSGTSPGQDPGVTGNDPTVGQGTEVNPYGVSYPVDNIGFKARDNPQATIPGDKIKNFKFVGYLNSDKSQGLTTISLADFFDPEMRQWKVIHVSVAGVWCYWCKEETKALEAPQSDGKALVNDLVAKKVVYLTALSEDINHQPAKQSDLDYWLAEQKTTYTQLLDPGNRNLGPFFTSAGIPWNGNIDARTMEILSSISSAPSSDGTTIDIMGDVQPWLDFVDSHPLTK